VADIPGYLEAEIRRRQAAMRAAGPSLPAAREQARYAAHWEAEWEWAGRDWWHGRRRRWLDLPERAPRPLVMAKRYDVPRPPCRVGELVRRVRDGRIGRVVGLTGRTPLVWWRGEERAATVSVQAWPPHGTPDVAPYRRRRGEEDLAEWRLASRALVGDPRWSRSPRWWGVA